MGFISKSNQNFYCQLQLSFTVTSIPQATQMAHNTDHFLHNWKAALCVKAPSTGPFLSVWWSVSWGFTRVRLGVNGILWISVVLC